MLNRTVGPARHLRNFLQAGTGAITRTWLAKARDIVSVFDFMTTAQIADVQARSLTLDVSAAVQAAVDTAEANGAGGRVYFPAGAYRFDTTVTVLNNGVWLEGDGPSATIIVNGQTNAAAISIGDNVTRWFRGGVRNLAFSQRSGITPTTNNHGLLVRKMGNWRFENIEVHDFPAALQDGLRFVDVTQSVFVSIGVQECTNSGIIWQDNCIDAYGVNLRSDGNGNNGFEILGCQGFLLVSCAAFGNDSHGWALGSQGSQDNANMFFVNCVGDTSGAENWFISELFDAAFTGCWGATQLSTVVNTGAAGFLLSGPSVKSVRFTNCSAHFNNGSGFRLLNDAGLPTDITFDNCQAGTTSNGSNGNGQGGTGYGYDLGGASNIRILGGIVQGNATGTVTGTGGSNVSIFGVIGVTDSPVVPYTNQSNTFGGAGLQQTFTTPDDFGAPFQVQSTNASANQGPFLDIDRASASPAANDTIGAFRFLGRDAGGNIASYALVGARILDTTDGSEDGELLFQPVIAGNFSTALRLHLGVQIGAPTSGYMGAGTLNLDNDLYKDGIKVVGAQGAAVADAAGGATVDAEARTAINALLARLRTHGLIAT